MPWAKLNATAAVSAEPPTAISQPVTGSMRRRRVETTSATPATSANPSSQPACPPSDSLSSRSGAGLAAERSRRRRRPRRRPARRPGRRAGRGRCSRGSARQMLLSDVPEIHGRDGRRRQRDQQRPRAPGRPPSRRRRPPARASGCAARPTPRRRSSPGRRAAPRPSWPRSRGPRTAPASASQRTRPSSNARTSAHSAPTTHSTSSMSGLLWRATATAIGVSASTAPATKPPARPKRRRVEVVDEPDRRDAHQRLRHEHAPRAEPERRAPTRPATHNAAGGLSTVITPAESSAP